MKPGTQCKTYQGIRFIFQWENYRFITFEISFIQQEHWDNQDLFQQETSTENQFDILMAHYRSTALQQEITGLEYLAYLIGKKCRRS